MEALDVLAHNLANVNTTGFKEQKTFYSMMNKAMEPANPAGSPQLVQTGSALNSNVGSMLETRRELDIALTGSSFLVVQTDSGPRYSRNGNLMMDTQFGLTTADGHPILGERGPIRLGPGRVEISREGEIWIRREGENPEARIRADKLRLVSIDNPEMLEKMGNSLFALREGTEPPAPAGSPEIRQGYLEQSNVNPMLATVRMVEIMRNFESIMRGLNLIVNEMDSKSIKTLGR
jgi:flagellar basal-body rod protein FlgF